MCEVNADELHLLYSGKVTCSILVTKIKLLALQPQLYINIKIIGPLQGNPESLGLIKLSNKILSGIIKVWR